MLIPLVAKRTFALTIAESPYGNRGTTKGLSKQAFEEEWAIQLPFKELRYPDDEYFDLART
jgi:hypothetical protein